MNLLICGAGGLAREVYQMLQDCGYEAKGFLAPENTLKNHQSLYLGSEEDYPFSKNDRVVLAIGEIKVREKVFTKLKERDVSFYTLIHPTAKVAATAHIGVGNIIGYHCVLFHDTNIGDGNLLNGNNLIHHDATIGNFNNLYSRVILTGGATLGDRNELGTAAVMLPGASLSDQCKLGAGSILHMTLKQSGHTLIGNPAGIVK